MRLSKAQRAMLFRKDVIEGEFWPNNANELRTYKSLEKMGLMDHRIWYDDYNKRRECKSLTDKGMRFVVEMNLKLQKYNIIDVSIKEI